MHLQWYEKREPKTETGISRVCSFPETKYKLLLKGAPEQSTRAKLSTAMHVIFRVESQSPKFIRRKQKIPNQLV